MQTDSHGFTPTGRQDQWRALIESSRATHAATCATRRPSQAGTTPSCDCTEYPMRLSLHAVVELHTPDPKARRVACVEHARTPIWSELAHAPDVCPDCDLRVELRCKACPSERWPCATSRALLAGADLLTPESVDKYLNRAVPA